MWKNNKYMTIGGKIRSSIDAMRGSPSDRAFQTDTVVEIDSSPTSDMNEFDGSLPEFRSILDVMATKLHENGSDNVRRVLFGMWFVHFVSMILIVWFSFTTNQGGDSDRLGLFMIVLQLYFAKILKSLNQMHDATTAIQSDSRSIQEDIVEISKIYNEKKQEYGIILTSQNYIIVISDLEHRLRNLATYILKDLRMYMDSLKTIPLIVNSFLWKSPHYKKYLERDAVNEAVRIINRHVDRKVNKCIKSQTGSTDTQLQQVAAGALQQAAVDALQQAAVTVMHRRFTP